MEAKIWNHSQWITETKPEALTTRFDKYLRAAGFNVLCFLDHHFQPQGWTGLWLLTESHFAVHTFPECGKTYIELSSCNRAFFVEFLRLLELEE